MNDHEVKPIEINVAARFDVIDHWIILTTNGAQPRVLRQDPRNLAASEIAIKLRLRVPKRVRRVAQTIVVTLPDELTHVAEIEVSIPTASEEEKA